MTSGGVTVTVPLAAPVVSEKVWSVSVSPLAATVPDTGVFSAVLVEPAVAVTVSLLTVMVSTAVLVEPSSVTVKVKLSVPVKSVFGV